MRSEPPPGEPATTGTPPALKPGFPVAVYTAPGSYQVGSSGVLVGDIDGDRELEVLVSGLAFGQITAVEPDGSAIPGWPSSYTSGHEYLGLAEADLSRPGFEITTIEHGERSVVLASNAEPVRGWPRVNGNYGSQAASAADLDGDRLDDLAYSTEDWQYTVRQHDGDIPPGSSWPRWVEGNGQKLSQPAVADLDGDRRPEVVGGGYETDGLDDKNFVAYRADGSRMPGWPRYLDNYSALHRVAVGQVDAEPGPEIVAITTGNPHHSMHLIRPDGTVKRSWPFYGDPSQGPALADLDGDGDQEIVTGGGAIRAYQGDGSVLPGFPIVATGYPSSEPSVVVGDVDNDGHQDIVVALSEEYGTVSGTVVTAVSREGDLLPGFPMTVPVQSDMAPAVADIDGNGRTDLLVAGSHVGTESGWHDGLFAFEYPTGTAAAPAWSQYGGGPRHQFTSGQALRPGDGPGPGTTTQTRIRLVEDTVAGRSGAAPRDLVALGSRVVYTADTPTSGREPWVSDGTATGTHALTDVRPGSLTSRAEELTRAGTRVFFVADDGAHGRELWSTDGTAAGTSLVADVHPGETGSRPRELTAVGNRVFFSGNGGGGRELWVSDGTPGGTRVVADPTPDAGVGTDPRGLARAGSRLVFDGADTVTDPGSPQLSLFGTDGTESGTVRLSRTSRVYRRAQSGTPYATIQADTTVIWSDGTPAGTTLTGAGWMTYGEDPMLGAVSARGGLGILSAADTGGNLEAFWTRPGSFGSLFGRGADGSTVPVRGPADFMPFRTGWLFSAADGAGRELWSSTGKASGTRRVLDLTKGARDSDPDPLLAGKGMALLRATTPSLGDELWRTDGTAAGTSLVTDLASGRRGSRVTEAVVAGTRVVMVADDGRSGRELWTMPLSLLGPLPNTTVTRQPASRTRSRTATVRFRSSIAGSRFRCRFDGGSPRRCSSPWSRTVRVGRHRLQITAIAPNGLREAVPAVVRWRVLR